MPIIIGRMFAGYVGVITFGFALVTINNVLSLDSTWSGLGGFYYTAVPIGGLLMAVLLQFFSWLRLRPVTSMLRLGPIAARDTHKSETITVLLRFPESMYRSVLAITVSLSLIYHSANFVVIHVVPDMRSLVGLASSLLAELSLSTLISLLIYIMLRRLFRPYLQQLQPRRIGSDVRTSICKPIRLMWSGGIAHFAMQVVFFLISRHLSEGGIYGQAIPSLLLLIALNLLLVVAMLVLFAREVGAETRIVTGGIQSLADGSGEGLHGRVPIAYPDEMGRVVESFNEVQQKVAERYERLAREFELARHVRRMLVPDTGLTLGRYVVEATAIGGNGELDGQWYDFIQLDERRCVIAGGRIERGGMSSSLLMTAALMALRGEFRNGTADGEDGEGPRLEQVRRSVLGSLHPYAEADVGLILLDAERGILEQTGMCLDELGLVVRTIE